MHMSRLDEICRRAFLQRLAALSAVGAGSSYALGLAGIGDLAAQSASDGYQALVCVFLFGGNDHANTLIPYDQPNYARYSLLRGEERGVAIARDELRNTVLIPKKDQSLTDDQTLALAPSMPRLKARFDQGVLAPILNVGPLLTPLTRSQYESSDTQRFPRPPKLFSHNDQQSTWQAFQPEGARTGWGGLLGDIALSGNTNSMFTAISARGNAVFLNGRDTTPYRLSAGGAVKMQGLSSQIFGSREAAQALEKLLRQQSSHVLENDYAMTNARSIEYAGFVEDALEKAPKSAKFASGNGLAGQMSLVARLISARRELGVTRQVFFVSMGGFDNHSGLKQKHQGLLADVDNSLDAFYSAIEALGLQSSVTTFTASDFGRTLTSNGNGSDHGWGGHHFVMGGDVVGGQFYGRAPHVATDTADQVGRGRLLPDISVDQYASTLAQWFGVRASDVSYLAPNIERFATSDLGFMRQRKSS